MKIENLDKAMDAGNYLRFLKIQLSTCEAMAQKERVERDTHESCINFRGLTVVLEYDEIQKIVFEKGKQITDEIKKVENQLLEL